MKHLLIHFCMFAILIVCTSYKEPEVKSEYTVLYEKEISEITENLSIANKKLDDAFNIVNDDKKLKQIKKKLKEK